MDTILDGDNKILHYNAFGVWPFGIHPTLSHYPLEALQDNYLYFSYGDVRKLYFRLYFNFNYATLTSGGGALITHVDDETTYNALLHNAQRRCLPSRDDRAAESPV